MSSKSTRSPHRLRFVSPFQAPSPASTGETNHSRNESNVSITATHIGVKQIKILSRITRAQWCEARGWKIPADENGDDEGYAIEYLDGGKPNIEGHEGYVTWTPTDVFDKAYRAVLGMTFGLAIEALKLGKKVARAGWNGKGMFLFLVPGSTFLVNRPPLLGIYPEGTEINYCPHIDMKTADGKVVPWLASQTDVLAEDWQVVE